MGSNFICPNYILLHVECQMSSNSDAMDIEWKLFALANWIWVGTLHQIQSEAPRSNFYCSNQCLFQLWELTSLVTPTIASFPTSLESSHADINDGLIRHVQPRQWRLLDTVSIRHMQPLSSAVSSGNRSYNKNSHSASLVTIVTTIMFVCHIY